MCSVRHRPMPSAPNSRALRASSGVSALARTRRRAQLVGPLEDRVELRRSTSGSTSGTSSVVIAPVVPSMAIRSPACSVRAVDAHLAGRDVDLERRWRRSPPGTPIPRATSAACEALPPSEVRIPLAAWKPATSSASVNGRTRITSRPSAAACDRVGGGEDDLALGGARRGGHAARPAPRTRPAGRRSGAAARRASRRRSSAAPAALSSSPSSTASTAKRTAACAGRLALRVCSMYSRPSSTVNSVSCMSP